MRCAQRGFVALAVIAGLVIVAAIAMLLVTESTMESDRAGRGIESLQAEYAALAAIEHAAWQAEQSSCENYALSTTAFGTHSYTASFSPTSGSPTTIDATATLASGISRSLSRPATRAYQPPNTPLILQPDAAQGSDTYLYEWKSTWNFGTSPTLWVDYRFYDSRAHALIKFDLGTIPFGARVSSAVLELYSSNPSLDGGPIAVHRITRTWAEGDESGGLGAGATWTASDAGASNWTTAGGDYAPTPYATTTVPAGIGWSSWDVTSLVADWVAGEFSNDGLLLRPAVSGSSSIAAHFASSDDSTAALRPKLTIEYSCECGIECTGPQTSGSVLMLVGDDSVPTPGDLAKIALMESWGYTVRLEGDTISAGGISSLMDTRDVLFVADSVDPTRVGTKLVGLAKGVVSEVGELNDEIGFSSGVAWTTGDTITIAENSHYITQLFDLGDLRIYDAAMEGVTVAGTPSPGLAALAQWSGATGLAVLEAGALTVSGGTAAGRRALLPFGRNIDPSYLNNNGRLIMQRALEWGASASGSGAGTVLMVVVDPATPTAQEAVKQALMESWNFAVNLIDESASQAEFDAAVATADVAYVAEDIASGTLGTKLRDVTIGVVVEDKESMVMFGIGPAYAIRNDTDLEIIDNNHYITETLGIGVLSITSSVQPLVSISGYPPADSATLGQAPGAPVHEQLTTIETGGTLEGGGTAAGRRVKLPWGDDDFDINSLTADGLTIMERAIEWGAGAGDTETPPPSGYLDQFNSRTCDAAQDYAGSDGTLDWSPWLWAEIDESDGPCAGRIEIQSDPLVPDPGSYRMVVNLNGRRMQRIVDLTVLSAPLLTFDFRLDSYPADDFFRLRISDNGGISWTELDRFEGPFHHTEYQSASYDLSAFIATDTILSFEFNGISTSSAAYFDNVRVYGDGAAGGTGHAVLMVVGNASSLTAGDDGRLQEMTAGGHTVTVFDDSESQSAFDAAVAANEVVFVTGSVSGGTLADKLTGAPKGIVNEFYGKLDNFGFSSQTGAFLGSADSFTATDSAHEITSPFGGNAVTVFTTGLAMPVPSGTIAPDLMRIGDVSGTGALVTLEAGAMRWDGSPAAARRVHLPFADAATTQMTADGVDIMQRAIAWAAGSGGGGGGGGGGGPGTCDGTYLDQFEVYAFDNSDGTLDWSTSPWQEIGESDGPTAGDIRIWSDLDSVRIRTRDNDNGGEGLEREADLTGATSATLTYDYRRHNLDNSNDFTVVEISANGAAGPWTQLAQYAGPNNDSNYVSASHDITGYISVNTRIRFVTSSNMGNLDNVWFDNIQIACTP